MIRSARPDDIPALLEMGRRFFDASGYAELTSYDPASFAETLTSVMESPIGCLLIAERNGEPAGFCCAIAFPFFFNKGGVNAQELFWWVDEAHRGSGIGAAMLVALEQWAESVGAKSLMMLSLASLDPESVARMYTKAGYRPAEQTFIKRL